MSNSERRSEKIKVIVTVQDQQYPMIERVMNDGSMGKTPAEVLRRVFLDWYRKKVEGSPPVSVTGHARDSQAGER